MKKKFFIPLCALAAIFAACSNDDNPIADQSAQEIKLFVSNTSDNQLATRGGRPLYGSEALQDVDSVVVYIYKEDDKVVSYVKTIDNWERVATASATGKTHSLKLTGQDRLTEGTYKLKAYAYSNSGTATFDPGLPVKGDNLVKDIQVATFTTDAEELFAGENTLVVGPGEDNPKFEEGNIVELNRQVAGAFGYFKNIPAKVRDKETVKIRLVASAKNTEVEFKANSPYQVNGKTPATPDTGVKFKDDTQAFTVYEVNVGLWFPEGSKNNDNLLSNGDKWVNPLVKEDVKILDNTILVGSFLAPFARVENVNTFELQLLAADGTITKTWNVGINIQDDPDDPDDPEVPNDTKFQYGVYRNHLYGIGKKTLNNPVTPGDGEEPIDLSRDQDIFIDINSTWDVIHSLELE